MAGSYQHVQVIQLQKGTKTKVFKILTLTWILCCLFVGCDKANNSIKESSLKKGVFSFFIQDEDGKPLKSVNLKLIDDNSTVIAVTNADGIAEFKLAVDPLYQFRFDAPGYFSIQHSFSEWERQRLNGKIPAITLVEKKPGRVMLAFGGDAMLGRRYHQPNPGEPQHISEIDRLADSKALLSPIKPYLDIATYTSINLECPIMPGEPEEKSTKNITFFSYPETLEALSWSGVDHVSLGNNHTADYFDYGINTTLAALNSSSLGFSGAGVNEKSALAAYQTNIESVDYSFLGYVGWAGTVEPSQVAEGENKGGAALGTHENIVASVASQGSDRVTVVEYHGSNEYSFKPTDETRSRLRASITAGADIAIGHHPHVLHGFEIYQDKLIAYSLGNFLFDQYIYETQRSALLYVWMDEDKFHRAEIVPLYIKGYRPTPAVDGIRNDVLRRLTHQSSLEGVELGITGGHGFIAKQSQTSRPESKSQSAPAPTYSSGLLKPLPWPEELASIHFKKPGIAYRIGRDWWSLGDFEQEGLFGLPSHNWQFSQAGSGIAQGSDNQGFLLRLKGGAETQVGQKYFMRVWDDRPKSVVFRVKPATDIETNVCLELRTLDMGIQEGRDNPQVQCLMPQHAEAQQWQELVFNFSPPARESLRGLRVRFDFRSKEGETGLVEVDDIRFISWETEGVSRTGETVELVEGNRLDTVQLLNHSADAGLDKPTLDTDDCCILNKSIKGWWQ